MRTLAVLHACLGPAAIGLGVVLARHRRDRPILERIALGSLPFTATVLVWQVVVTIGFVPVVGPWSAARLAPAASLVYGYKLYYPPGVGPSSGWLYPPVAPLVYLPAALIGDPIAAVLVGRCLSLLCYFGPAAWLLLGEGRHRGDRQDRLIRLILFLTFALLTGRSRPLRYCATEVHADAPALGLGAAAVVLLARSRQGSGSWSLAGALVLATLSAWTKQLATPILLLVLPAWAWVTGGLRSVVQLALAALVWGLGVSLLILALIDQGSFLFHVVTVPLRHPLRIGSTWGIVGVLVDLGESHLLVVLLLAIGLLGWLALRPEREQSEPPASPWLEAWPWLLIAALAELPLALRAYAKVGGDDNNLGFLLYFLVLGTLRLWARLMVPGRSASGESAGPWLLLVATALNLTVGLLTDQQIGLALVRPGPTWRQEHAAAYRYIQRHRGEVYLPWNPLEHLAAEGALYHFEYGVYDRALAGLPLTGEHFRRYIPPRTRLVCYPPQTTVADQATLRYLTEFTRRVEEAELPGWSCYARR